jgi:hypothetical protein
MEGRASERLRGHAFYLAWGIAVVGAWLAFLVYCGLSFHPSGCTGGSGDACSLGAAVTFAAVVSFPLMVGTLAIGAFTIAWFRRRHAAKQARPIE